MVYNAAAKRHWSVTFLNHFEPLIPTLEEEGKTARKQHALNVSPHGTEDEQEANDDDDDDNDSQQRKSFKKIDSDIESLLGTDFALSDEEKEEVGSKTSAKKKATESDPIGVYNPEWQQFTFPNFRTLPLDVVIEFLASPEARKLKLDYIPDGRKKGKRYIQILNILTLKHGFVISLKCRPGQPYISYSMLWVKNLQFCCNHLNGFTEWLLHTLCSSLEEVTITSW